MSQLLSQGDASSTSSMIKGAIIGRIVGFLVLVSFVVLLGYLAKKLFEKYFPMLTPNSKSVGASCLESFECIGYKVGDGPACCGTVGSKTCTQKVKDLAGNWYCPEEATGQKKIGDSCVESFECHGYKDGDGPACCGPAGQKTCTNKVKDLVGNWYCPEEATGQKKIGESCKESFECHGYKDGDGPACCGPVGHKTCTNKLKDWIGAWYCPAECVGSFGGKLGSCKAK